LFGLVVVSDPATETLEGRQVTLTPQGGAPITTRIDDVGNFEFAGLAVGAYALEIDLPESVIVVEELRVE
jgi:hypothetical protein